MGKITGRLFRPSDISGIVRLYNFITGRARTDQQHRWEWVENPLRESDIWVLEDESTSEVVGHHGLIPLAMNYKGESFIAGKTENSILDPKYAGTGIYFIHEQKFFKNIKKKYDLLFTTSGHGLPGKIRKQLGYKDLATYAKYFLITNPNGFTRLQEYYVSKRKLSSPKQEIISFGLIFVLWIIHLFTRKINVLPHKTQFQAHTSMDAKLATDLDTFWENNKQHYPMTINRNSAYLKWRIFDNPNINHSMVTMYSEKNELLGYVILAFDQDNFPKGVIIDVISSNKNESYLKDLIQESLHFFKLQNISYIEFSTLKSQDVLNKVFSEMGFIDSNSLPLKKTQKSNFMVYFCETLKDKSLMDPNLWYYTQLFTEGFVI